MIVIIVHEAAHAMTGAALGIPSTLFNFWVNHQFDAASLLDRALVGAAGPSFSLLLGLSAGVLYFRLQGTAVGLPLLLVAAQGVSNFFGNLVSAAFVGDFSNAAVILDLSPAARYAASAIGLAGLAVVLFAAGRHLARWVPPGIGPWSGVALTMLVPLVAGTVGIIVLNQPTPMGSSFATARVGETAFWVFGAVGMLSARAHPNAEFKLVSFRAADAIVAIVVVFLVRLMANGIPIG